MKINKLVFSVFGIVLAGQVMAIETYTYKQGRDFVTGAGATPFNVDAFNKACASVGGQTKVFKDGFGIASEASCVLTESGPGNNPSTSPVKVRVDGRISTTINLSYDDRKGGISKQEIEEKFASILPCATGCDGFEVTTGQWFEHLNIKFSNTLANGEKETGMFSYGTKTIRIKPKK